MLRAGVACGVLCLLGAAAVLASFPRPGIAAHSRAGAAAPASKRLQPAQPSLRAFAHAAPPSPRLLGRARRDQALAARIKAFERNAKSRGVNASTRRTKDVPQGADAGAPSRVAGGADADAAARVPARSAVPSVGRLPTLALLVDFADAPRTVSPAVFDELLFADVFGPGSLRGYYREASHGTPSSRGLLDIFTLDSPAAVGWLRLPGTLASYTSGGDYGIGPYPGNSQRMVEDAVAAADAVIDFSDYDSNGDGFVDNLLVVHAGRGAEYSGSTSDMWSHQWGTSRPVAVDGVFVSTYAVGPEYWVTPGDMTVGVYAHEMGHVFGLPDLYDRDLSSSGVGGWSLMGTGSWNGTNGDSPSRLDAWCAARLGWLQPQTADGELSSWTLSAVSASRTQSAAKVKPVGASDAEYFLIENRQQTGTDSALPGGGLLIWHIDENQMGVQNDDETHKLVDLEEAGGYQQLDSSYGYGSPDDPFPGTSGARQFLDSTTPNAATYDGLPSGVMVTDIGDSGEQMTVRIGSVAPPDITAPALRLEGAVNGGHYRRDVTLTITADDGAVGSGVASVSCSVDGSDFRFVEGDVLEQVVPAAPNGVHLVVCRAVDRAGNLQQRQWTFTTDSVGPAGYARKISGLRRRTIAVPYKLTDRLSSRLYDVKVVIKRRSGARAKTFATGPGVYRVSGRWYSFTWRPVDRGTYRYWVYGRDKAGNVQRIAGYGTITVR